MTILSNPWFLLLVLMWHWIWDFVLQQHKYAANKWRSDEALMRHTLPYSFSWVPFMIILGPNVATFIIITLVTHTIIDRQTSKLTHYYFFNEDYHKGFVVVGFDQILHYVQLYLTFKLLL